MGGQAVRSARPTAVETPSDNEHDQDLIAFLGALSDETFDKTVPERVPSGLPVGGQIEQRRVVTR